MGRGFVSREERGWGTRRTCDIGCVLEFLVISAPAGRVDQAAGDARDEQLVGDGKLNDRVERFFPRREHRVEFLCLRDRAGEPVEHKAAKSKPHFNSHSKLLRRETTYPFLHCLLFSSWSRIIPTMMSSETSPPASMIFFASTPSDVFFDTCSRSMSPVARWHTQNSSRIRGACVPFPVTHHTQQIKKKKKKRASSVTGRGKETE